MTLTEAERAAKIEASVKLLDAAEAVYLDLQQDAEDAAEETGAAAPDECHGEWEVVREAIQAFA